MPNDATPILTDEQKREICKTLASGCDRETAAKYARTTWAEMHAAMHADGRFGADVRRAEAGVELRHMLRLEEASKKESNWRISAWWLERLAPDRYGPRGAGTVNPRELRKFIEQLGTVLYDEVHNQDDRDRLVKRLEWTSQTLELFLRDDLPPEGPTDDVDIIQFDFGTGTLAAVNGPPRGGGKEPA